MVADPAGELEDWRLFALADAASRQSDEKLADRALALLLERGSSAPLRGRALLVAAQRAWDRGETERALNWIELARTQRLPRPRRHRRRRAGVAHRRRPRRPRRRARRRQAPPGELAGEGQRAARRRRLPRRDRPHRQLGRRAHPRRGRAARREVARRRPGARRRQYARHHSRCRPRPALVPAAGRGPDATRPGRPRLRAAAQRLPGDQRGRGAAGVGARAAPPPTWRPRVRGANNLQSSERTRMLAMAQKHLRRVVALDVDTATSVPAVRKLYGLLAESGRFDEAMEMLELLRKLDPADRTGASHLWKRGWDEFEHEQLHGGHRLLDAARAALPPRPRDPPRPLLEGARARGAGPASPRRGALPRGDRQRRHRRLLRAAGGSAPADRQR